MPLFTFPNHNKAKICAIADMMLDYIDGSCERISSIASAQVVDVNTILNSNS